METVEDRQIVTEKEREREREREREMERETEKERKTEEDSVLCVMHRRATIYILDGVNHAVVLDVARLLLLQPRFCHVHGEHGCAADQPGRACDVMIKGEMVSVIKGEMVSAKVKW